MGVEEEDKVRPIRGEEEDKVRPMRGEEADKVRPITQHNPCLDPRVIRSF